MPHFQTKPIAVEAVQLRCSYTFGRSKGRAGDWLVIHADGRQEIVGAAAFAAGYVPIANGAPAPPPSESGGGGSGNPRLAGARARGRPAGRMGAAWTRHSSRGSGSSMRRASP